METLSDYLNEVFIDCIKYDCYYNNIEINGDRTCCKDTIYIDCNGTCNENSPNRKFDKS